MISRLMSGLSTPLSSCRRIAARTAAFACASARSRPIAPTVISYDPQAEQSSCTAAVTDRKGAVRPQKMHAAVRVEFTCVAPPGLRSLQPDARGRVPGVPLALSQRVLADHLGCDVKVVNRIVNGRCAVTAGMALRLGVAFRTSPAFWMSAQKAVDLYEAAGHVQSLPRPLLKAS